MVCEVEDDGCMNGGEDSWMSVRRRGDRSSGKYTYEVLNSAAVIYMRGTAPYQIAAHNVGEEAGSPRDQLAMYLPCLLRVSPGQRPDDKPF